MYVCMYVGKDGKGGIYCFYIFAHFFKIHVCLGENVFFNFLVFLVFIRMYVCVQETLTLFSLFCLFLLYFAPFPKQSFVFLVKSAFNNFVVIKNTPISATNIVKLNLF